MKNKKLNLIIDGNNIFFQSLFIVTANYKTRSKGAAILDTEEEQEMLIRKVATDLSYIIRQFSGLNRIIFTIDSKSWRKNIEIEENEGYKSSREKSTGINWDNLYACIKEFSGILDDFGIISSKLEMAEGDDLLYLWQREFRQQNENSIIVSGDKDLHQLAKLENNVFTIVYMPNSKNRKLILPDGFVNWMDKSDEDVNIFDANTYMNIKENAINKLLNKIPYNEIDNNKFAIEKVFTGDKGDTVPSVYTWENISKSGNKVSHRLTPKRVEKILEVLPENVTIYDLPKYSKEITQVIEKLAKTKNLSVEQIKNKIERNIKLMILNDETIPEDIQENFSKQFDEAMKLPSITNKEFSMNNLLENTRFVKPAKTFQADIFSEINKYADNKNKDNKNLF